MEADGSWSGIKGGTTALGATIDNNVDWTSTVTGRAGMAFDRWLIYATAGLAYASYQSDLGFSSLAGKSVSAEFESTRLGAVAGLGVERAVWNQWTTRVEYMYANFGRTAYSLNAVSPFDVVSSKANVSEHILRVGFNRLFN